MALSSAAGTPAWAAPTEAESSAQRLFEAGSMAYDKGRFDDAARAFEEAYRLLPRPAIAFSLAQSLRRQYFVDKDIEHLRRAADLFESYARDVPEGRRRGDAVEQLQALALLLAVAEPVDGEDPAFPREPTPATTELIVYADVEGAEVSIDGGPFGPSPMIAAAEPGPHRVRVRAVGYSEAETTEIAVAQRIIPVAATLVPLPVALTVGAPTGAHVTLDGRELGVAPLTGPVITQPGSHRVAVTAPGRVAFVESFDAQRGQAIRLDAVLPPTTQRRIAWGMLGGAGGLGLAGGITTGLAFAFQSRVRATDEMRDEVNLQPEQLDAFNRDLDRRDGLRRATIGLWAGAVVLGVTGLALVLTDATVRRRAPRSSASSLLGLRVGR